MTTPVACHGMLTGYKPLPSFRLRNVSYFVKHEIILRHINMYIYLFVMQI